jgi:hypothetical protein
MGEGLAKLSGRTAKTTKAAPRVAIAAPPPKEEHATVLRKYSEAVAAMDRRPTSVFKRIST